MNNDQRLSELKRRADLNDPTAMYEYAMLVQDTDPEEAFKYIVFSAQLGYPSAMELVADDYAQKGDMISAALYYRLCARAGLTECSVKLAVIHLNTHEHAALFELEELAQMGVMSAIEALADYYKKKGNRKESAYWRSLLK